jgi:hypothetical protein
MAKKQSEMQDAVAEFWENVATMVQQESGVFMGDNLNAAETRTVVSQARGLAKDMRAKASRNRSIGA